MKIESDATGGATITIWADNDEPLGTISRNAAMQIKQVAEVLYGNSEIVIALESIYSEYLENGKIDEGLTIKKAEDYFLRGAGIRISISSSAGYQDNLNGKVGPAHIKRNNKWELGQIIMIDLPFDPNESVYYDCNIALDKNGNEVDSFLKSFNGDQKNA